MFTIKLIILLLLSTTYVSLAQNANDVVGKYHLPNNLDVEIFESEGKYFGKIIALNGYENGQKKDINNSEESRQNDPLIGIVIIKDLEYDKDDKEWINGSMYSPGKGMVFNLKITKMMKDKIEVVGSKYFFWKTMEWEKL